MPRMHHREPFCPCPTDRAFCPYNKMKHTSLLQSAERWTKNAARTVWKNMTYDNAMKAMTVASLVPAFGASVGAVRAGMAAGSGMQVARGLATGLTTAASLAPTLAPAASAAQGVSSAATAASESVARSTARRRAQGPMTAQAYLNDYGIPLANPNWGTRSQYETARARISG